MKFAAHVAKAELAGRKIDAQAFDFGVLGITIGQYQSFYGAPWTMYEIGLKDVAGPTLSQACATGPRVLLTAAAEIQLGMATTALVLGTDRTSNGPHIYYPAPASAGGTGTSEDQVLYNFGHEPVGGHSMLQTAENVAARHGITTAEQHEVVLRRSQQYGEALKEGRAFQKRYMTLPFAVPKPNFKGEAGVLDGDEGIVPSTVEGLAKLKPVVPNGTVTFGGQTHPADGTAGLIVTSADKAKARSSNPNMRGVCAPSVSVARSLPICPKHPWARHSKHCQCRYRHRADQSGEVTQSICGERYRVLAQDRLSAREDEQLWLFADLGPPACGNGSARHYRAHRGACDRRRRPGSVSGLCSERHLARGGDRSERSQVIASTVPA